MDMWPRPPEQTFVLPIHGGSTWTLASIGHVVFLEKMFENGGRRRMTTTDEACLYYKLTYEPKGSGELKWLFCIPQDTRSKKF